MQFYKFERIVLFFLLITFLYLFTIKDSTETYITELYVVEEGDTAWGIMSRNNPANKDIRELIYYIGKDNNIKPGYLDVGQEIKIRIYEKEVNYE